MSYINKSLSIAMNEIVQKNTDFMDIYNKSYRLAAAVFMISTIMDENEELRTKIKKLSLDLVSTSVHLKDISFSDVRKLMVDLEKNSLELMSMIDIASVAGLISKMNAGVIKEEFQSFILELGRFSERFDNKNTSIKSIFTESSVQTNISNNSPEGGYVLDKAKTGNTYKNDRENGNGNGHKRKDLRKNMILEFIKRHENVSIKDIVPNIIGCSEKTVQRELVSLINELKVKKVGERRWSRYSIIE